MATPKQNDDKLAKALTAWTDLASTASFGGMTLLEFKSAIQPSLDARQVLKDLQEQMDVAETARDLADKTSLPKQQQVVAGVLADPNYGPDSALYEAMGYVRKSQRKTGLTRKGKKSA